MSLVSGLLEQGRWRLYKLVADHAVDLSDLLRLPLTDRIVELMMARHADLPEEGYRESLRAQYDRLKEAANMYFQTDRVIVDAFNKTKHGAPMVRLFEPENPRLSGSWPGFAWVTMALEQCS
jgi:hypothetical protein